MTRSEPAVLVLSPMPLRPRAKMVGNMMDMKRLVVSRHMAPNPAWMNNGDEAEYDVHDGVDSRAGCGRGSAS